MDSAKGAIAYIQDQLVKSLMRLQLGNRVVDYCIDTLRITNGLITISDLESKTGYTRRYLEMLFRDHVGFSPKVISSILRFQKFYKKWARARLYEEVRDELYDYYYDQAHFAKEFKRMTGFSPQHFSKQVTNEFGRRLLLGQ